MHEAHIHTLANMYDCKIIVAQPEKTMVRTTLYSPGWEPQKPITRQEVKNLMRSGTPPILLHLNDVEKHFSAYACHTGDTPHENPARKRGRQERGEGKSRATGIDCT